MKIPSLTRKGWSYAIGFVLLSALLVHLVYGDTLFGNAVNPSGRVAAAAPQFPSKFYVRHVAISTLTHRFNIQADGAPNLGRIDEQFLNWGKKFRFLNSTGDEIFVAHQQPFALGTTIDLFDGKGAKIGTIQKQIVQSLFKKVTFYKLLGPDGSALGESAKLDLFVTSFYIRDRNNNLLMTISRPWINWPTDRWDVTIHESSINPAFAATIAVYKSAADAQ